MVSSVCYTFIVSHSVCWHVGRGQSSRRFSLSRESDAGPAVASIKWLQVSRLFSRAYFHSLTVCESDVIIW